MPITGLGEENPEQLVQHIALMIRTVKYVVRAITAW